MYKINSRYKIEGFTDNCPSSYMHNLLSMGFLPGVIFLIKKVAPLADPYQVEIKGTSVSMRKTELAFIEVTEV